LSKFAKMKRPKEEVATTTTPQLSCIGFVYIDRDQNVRVDLSRNPCPSELVKAIEESLQMGKEIIFDVGRRKKTT
jgi:hypothetical protein